MKQYNISYNIPHKSESRQLRKSLKIDLLLVLKVLSLRTFVVPQLRLAVWFIAIKQLTIVLVLNLLHVRLLALSNVLEIRPHTLHTCFRRDNPILNTVVSPLNSRSVCTEHDLIRKLQ